MKLYLKTKPWPHQLAALRYFLKRNKQGQTFGTLFTDMGSGKTKIMIDFINAMNFNLTLIVAPKKAAELVWPKEIAKHSSYPYLILDLTKYSSERKAQEYIETVKYTSMNLIVIVNYESVWRKPFSEVLLKTPPKCVICDELHRIKGAGSKCSRFMHILSRRVKYRYGMTGTPLGQSPLDVYAQYRFIDDTIFGTRLDAFTDKYANMVTMTNNTTGDTFRALDKGKPFKNLKELQERMFSCAFRTNSEIKLPPTTEVLVEYQISPKLENTYKELQKEGCLMLSDTEYVNSSNVLALVTRLQQVINGYLPVTDIETKKTRLEEFDTYRQKILSELIDGIPTWERIVIFCKYRKDIKDIIKICEENDRDWAEISGRHNGYDEWILGKKILIVQIQSGSEGLDFTLARYCIDYDLHYSLLLYKQSRKRIHRPGQTRPVTYFTIIARLSKGKSIDEQIYNALQRNANIIDEIMENRKI